MNKYDMSERNQWKKILSRMALVLISVVIIVLFIPRNSGPQFRYDVGKPWMYGSLIAKFDFPIYKTDEAIKQERDSLLRNFEPYFNFKENMESAQMTRFFEDFTGGLPGMPATYTNIVADKLHQLYKSGIMGATEFSSIAQDTTKMIRVIDGKTAYSVRISRVLSTMTAYEQIYLDERLAPYRAQLQRCNLNEYIEPNLIYDKERSEAEKNDLLGQIPLASGMVLAGQKIVDRGEIVDDYTFRVLSSFEKETQRRSASTTAVPSTIAGQVIFVSLFIILFTMYLGMFRRDYFSKPRSIAMLYAMITVFPILVSLMIEHNVFSVYILPFAMAPIFIRVFMDSRTAFLTHIVMVMLCAAAVKYQYEFIIVQLVAGLVAIYSLRELSQRGQLFKTALFVTLASCAIYFALQLMTDNTFTTIDNSMYKYFVINGIMLLFVYPLMLIIEKTFGFISNVTLIELSNTSKDLLRRLSEVAPGTFQHSIMVSNLASAIAEKIGAKAQLVRTGALYHDIGKMQNPAFFTENQNGVNPLDNMSRIDAAHIVINHVTDGLKLAEKYNLPGVIKDFISTHHGAGMTKYFYVSYRNEHPDEPIDDSLFTYPGPNPFTREQAILMMADSVEAAARSLPEYTEFSISNIVNKIVDGQLKEGYFEYCPITFHDIAMAKQVLIERLKSIYHTRVSYPELKKPALKRDDEE
ncbi:MULTISPECIES: HD family phosphohydrolase [Prevotella]|jgi:putative nucleotidyltransferase with HDIG domain|uniref:Hydrolase n=1 Tax=Prevotella pectinovora TaxID=1602169 RepID=A0A0D0HC34_9BACT|nr:MULTISPECIES: HDIG domain-containing metalloprotein [Prevotella]KIP55890.1 hydrolase [Prevotella pectinovora]KIP61923.1 hydrolase [Prevotella pectinovora]CDD04530.1 hD phosphohydrolase family protein [Prevotella sp. CAG:592]